jgi:hypothetical protein
MIRTERMPKRKYLKKSARPTSFDHRPNAPLRGIRWNGVERCLNHVGDMLRRQGRTPTRAGRILGNPYTPAFSNRRRHRYTIGRATLNAWAIALTAFPSADASTIMARTATRCGVFL